MTQPVTMAGESAYSAGHKMRPPVQVMILAVSILSAGSRCPAQTAEDSARAALDLAAGQLASDQPRQALATLDPVEALEPDNPWMWFYRGSAWLQLGEPYRAMEAYDRASKALADLGNPDPELAEKIRVHHYRARRQVFRITLQPSLAYDSNVSYTGTGGTGLGLISGRGDGLFGSDVRLDWAPVATQHEAVTVGARLGNTWHFSVEQYDLQDYGGYVRYARKLSDAWEAGLQYDYDMILLGRESFLSNHAITPSLTYHWAAPSSQLRPASTKVFYQFVAQDFLSPTPPEYDRDGLINAVGAEQAFTLRPLRDLTWEWNLNLGYRFDHVATQGTQFDRSDHTFYAGTTIPLINPIDPTKYLILPDKELRFRFDAQWEIDRYRNPTLLDRDYDRRSDYIPTLTFGLSQKLIEDPSYGDLTLHTLISWMDSMSNLTPQSQYFPYTTSSPYTYEKVVYGVQVEWSW